MTLGAQRKAVREFDEEKVRKVVLERVIKERSIDIARALKKNGVDIKPLETDNLVLLLNENVNGELIEPTKEEVEELAEVIYHEHPEKSKLHFFIAEKQLLLREIEKVIEEHRNNQ
ncbi:MAG: hypothetical protein ACFE96_18780 [Candidatus Hermodarchaeota archaeon]